MFAWPTGRAIFLQGRGRSEGPTPGGFSPSPPPAAPRLPRVAAGTELRLQINAIGRYDGEDDARAVLECSQRAVTVRGRGGGDLREHSSADACAEPALLALGRAMGSSNTGSHVRAQRDTLGAFPPTPCAREPTRLSGPAPAARPPRRSSQGPASVLTARCSPPGSSSLSTGRVLHTAARGWVGGSAPRSVAGCDHTVWDHNRQEPYTAPAPGGTGQRVPVCALHVLARLIVLSAPHLSPSKRQASDPPGS